jgi:hypothetical protein
VLANSFGEAPHRLDRNDLALIEAYARGASVYTSDDDNVWQLIAAAIANHGGVEIEVEY